MWLCKRNSNKISAGTVVYGGFGMLRGQVAGLLRLFMRLSKTKNGAIMIDFSCNYYVIGSLSVTRRRLTDQAHGSCSGHHAPGRQTGSAVVPN